MERIRKPINAHLLWTLFRTCFVISACTFGGGMVVISMLQKKFVDELHWISEDEVMDMVAIAQSCPGVMAVNTSIIIGYRIAGPIGAILTVLGTVTPPMVILAVISAFYTEFRTNRIVALVLKGMQAGVAAVMINVTYSMVRNVLKDKKIIYLLMFIAASIAYIIFKLDIIILILACGIIGGIYTFSIGKEENA